MVGCHVMMKQHRIEMVAYNAQTSTQRLKSMLRCNHSDVNLARTVAMEVLKESTALSAFTCFPKLAPEIRSKIWRLVVLKPRILELELDAEDRVWQMPTPSSRIIPQTLHASHESRQEALKIYDRLSFGPWINLFADTIYVRTYTSNSSNDDFDFQSKFLELLGIDPIFKQLRFLALWTDMWSKDDHPHYRYKVLEALPKLTELSIIWNDNGISPDYSYWKGSEVIFEDFEGSIMSNTESRNRARETRLGPQSSKHYLLHDLPKFKFPNVRRDRPA